MGGTPLSRPRAVEPGNPAPAGNLGRLALGFLAVCAVSGFALVPFYSPGRALESLERLNGALPWGSFLRAVHAWAGFGLLATAVAHLLQVWAARSERQLSKGLWWASVLLLPLVVAALLGGFTLRGDAEASAALRVWRGILESVPFARTDLSRLVLGAGGDRLGTVGLHHAGTFTVLVWVLTAAHGKRLLPDRRSAALAGLISAAFAGVLPLPLGSAERAISFGSAPRLVLGPWYLLGLQGALVNLPAVVGWIGPLLLVLILGLLREASGLPRKALVALAASWAAVYLVFTARALLLAR